MDNYKCETCGQRLDLQYDLDELLVTAKEHLELLLQQPRTVATIIMQQEAEVRIKILGALLDGGKEGGEDG